MTALTSGRIVPTSSKSFHVSPFQLQASFHEFKLTSRSLDDFFVGIGDINASFLPKLPDPVGTAGAPPPKAAPSGAASGSNGSSDSVAPSLAASPYTASPAPASTEIDMTKGEVEAAIVAEAQSKAVTSQLEDRPLAKMQKELDKTDEDGQTQTEDGPQVNGHSNGTKEKNGREHHHHHKGKALLSNDDWELERIWNVRAILSEVAPKVTLISSLGLA